LSLNRKQTFTVYDNRKLVSGGPICLLSFDRVHIQELTLPRIIATWYQMNQDQEYPSRGVGVAPQLTLPHKIVNARDPAAKQTLLDGAIEGHVLVKNVNNALPLKSPQLLSLYGYSATAAAQNNPSLAWSLGFESTDPNAAVGVFAGAPAPGIALDGMIISGGGSGAVTPPYASSPFDAIQQRAYEDNTALLWDFTNQTYINAVVDTASDACLVFINAFATEGGDRPYLNDTYSDTIVKNVANLCNNTIVVIHNAGIRLVDAFADNPNVTAIIYAHLPGQDAGRALVNILYGDVSPSGKLPYTVAKSASDYGALASASRPEGKYWLFPQSNFSEGVYIDYRAFDKAGIQPRYEFGFGLSYTTFSYSNLQVSKLSGVSSSAYASGPILQGGQEDIWDVLVQVTADITNTGKVPGAEVAQLYVGIPGGPVRQLRGFSKVGIEAGKTASVHFDLLRRDLSVWDIEAQKWMLQKGEYKLYVGASSRKLLLNGTVTI
jgi:beta-glucosidase